MVFGIEKMVATFPGALAYRSVEQAPQANLLDTCLWWNMTDRTKENFAPPSPVFAIQLAEAREEWRRRHPKPPQSWEGL